MVGAVSGPSGAVSRDEAGTGRALRPRSSRVRRSSAPVSGAGARDLARALVPSPRSSRALEIGPGTGLATREVASLGVGGVVAVEPDAALAEHLRATWSRPTPLEVVVEAFEEVDLPTDGFRLGLRRDVVPLDRPGGRAAQGPPLLRPGGLWAMFWNVFGDPTERTLSTKQPDRAVRAVGGTARPAAWIASRRSTWSPTFAARRRVVRRDRDGADPGTLELDGAGCERALWDVLRDQPARRRRPRTEFSTNWRASPRRNSTTGS